MDFRTLANHIPQGPILAYLKKVSDATQNPSAGPGDGWFKIAEAGLISSSKPLEATTSMSS